MKQLAQKTALIFFVRAFPNVAAAFCAILFSRILPQSVYGSYQQFWAQVLLLSSLAGIGLQSLLITLPAADARQFLAHDRKPRLFLAISIVLASIILVAIQQKSSVWMTLTGIGLLAAYTLTSIVEAGLFHQSKFRLLAMLNGIYALAFVGIHLLGVTLDFSLPYLYAGALVLVSAKLLYMLSVLRTQMQQPAGAMKPKRVGHLWAHLAVYDATQAAFKWIDKVVLALLLPPATFAIYFNGTYDVPLLPLLLGATGSALLLHFSTKENSIEQQVCIQYKAATKMSLVVFPVFCFLAVFRTELFTVVLSPKYTEAASLFLVAILVLPLRAYNFTTILQHAGKGRIINTGAVADLIIALVLMYPLYLLLGLHGVALSFVLSTYVQAGYYLFHTAKLSGLNVFRILPLGRWALALITFSIAYMLLYYGLRTLLSPAITLLLGAVVTGLVVLIPVARALYSKPLPFISNG